MRRLRGRAIHPGSGVSIRSDRLPFDEQAVTGRMPGQAGYGRERARASRLGAWVLRVGVGLAGRSICPARRGETALEGRRRRERARAWRLGALVLRVGRSQLNPALRRDSGSALRWSGAPVCRWAISAWGLAAFGVPYEDGRRPRPSDRLQALRLASLARISAFEVGGRFRST
jgi:hypothetical protein